MQFDSLTFIVFFIAISSVYYLLSGWSSRKNFLLAASYVFYAAWNPLFLPLLIAVSLVDWILVNLMARRESDKRRAVLIFIIFLNLAVLAYFKYAYFFASNFIELSSYLGVNVKPPVFSIILPIGISFYIFHSLSYAIDVYRKKFSPVTSLRDYMLYVGFFPQLVAGPIVRWSDMKAQIEEPRSFSVNYLGFGVALMIVGLFQKIVMADAIFAPVANSYFSAVHEVGFWDAWIGALSFSGQILCDFAGYTTCALGGALILGFRLPINFLNPYASVGFSDFWRRWHISLSTWLRDYLYIPLGGGRSGNWKTYRNLMLTMLIGGLWHGAAWNFIVWGGIHGVLLILERTMRNPLSGLPLILSKLLVPIAKLLTFLVITLTWVWFRSESFPEAWHSTAELLHLSNLFSPLPKFSGAQLLSVIAIFSLVTWQWMWKEKTSVEVISKLPSPLVGVMLGLCLAAIILSPGESNAFIYFQF